MPFPLIPLIAAAGSIGSSIFNNQQAKDARSWQNTMYDKQRADMLADRAFENHYNSPAEQMNRLKAAGLNPNLVYGGGAGSMQSVSSRNSSIPSTSQSEVSNPVNDAMAAYYRAKTMELNIDNTKSVIKLRQEQGDLAYQKTATERHTTDNKKLETSLLEQRRHIGDNTLQQAIEASKLRNDKLRADIKFTMNEDERQTAKNSSDISEAVTRIALNKANTAVSQERRNEILQRVELLRKEGILKNYEIRLAKQGMTKHDPAWYRAIEDIVDLVLNKNHNIDNAQ